MQPRSVPGSYFVDLYCRNPDPWDFAGSQYECDKYDASVGELRADYASALELGCSIGVFTQRLARRCRAVLGVDVSPEALRSANRRCGRLCGVRFREASIPADFPGGRFDLIALCEMGYYLDPGDLQATKRHIADALTLSGDLLLVHWRAPVNGHAQSAQAVHGCFTGDARFATRVHREHDRYLLDVLTRTTVDG